MSSEQEEVPAFLSKRPVFDAGVSRSDGPNRHVVAAGVARRGSLIFAEAVRAAEKRRSAELAKQEALEELEQTLLLLSSGTITPDEAEVRLAPHRSKTPETFHAKPDKDEEIAKGLASFMHTNMVRIDRYSKHVLFDPLTDSWHTLSDILTQKEINPQEVVFRTCNYSGSGSREINFKFTTETGKKVSMLFIGVAADEICRFATLPLMP